MTKIVDQNAIKNIWTLAWPVMVGQLLHSFMVTADMWFVSQIGSTEAAAAGSATSLLGVIQVIPFLVSAGAIALVARYTGAENHSEIKEITFNSLGLALIIGAGITGISFLFTNQLLGIFGDADVRVMALAKSYVKVVFLGLPFFFFNATSRAVIQATGDTKNPVKIFILANLINILFDYIFIMVLGYGIEGAATATVIAEIVATVLMIKLVLSNIYSKSLHEFFNAVTFRKNLSKRILKIGGFAALQQFTRPFTGLIMFRIVLEISVEAGAAFGIGGRMFNFVFIFLAGLGTAMSVMVGQTLGRGDIHGADRLIKYGVGLALINMTLFAIPFYIIPEYLMSLFVTDPVVVASGAEYLRITYTGVLTVAFSTVFGAAFAGAGDTFPPMLASLIGNWVVKVPLAILLTSQLNLGPTGVWLAISLSVIVESIIIWGWFRKGKWKTRSI